MPADVAERRSRESLRHLHAVDAARPAQAPGLAVGSRRAGRPPECWAAFDAVVNVTQDEYEGMAGDARYLQVPVAEGKRDKVGLVQHLPAALRFVAARLAKGDRVLVHCAQGRDRSVGVALAVLATCFDEDLALDAERCAAVAAHRSASRARTSSKHAASTARATPTLRSRPWAQWTSTRSPFTSRGAAVRGGAGRCCTKPTLSRLPSATGTWR